MRLHREAVVGQAIRLLLQTGRPDQAMNVMTTMRPTLVQDVSVLFSICKAMVEQQQWRKLRLLGTLFEIGTKSRDSHEHIRPEEAIALEGARAAICFGASATGDLPGIVQLLQSMDSRRFPRSRPGSVPKSGYP